MGGAVAVGAPYDTPPQRSQSALSPPSFSASGSVQRAHGWPPAVVRPLGGGGTGGTGCDVDPAAAPLSGSGTPGRAGARASASKTPAKEQKFLDTDDEIDEETWQWLEATGVLGPMPSVTHISDTVQTTPVLGSAQSRRQL